MKTCLSVLLVSLMAGSAFGALGSYSDDFEGYSAYAATANNGNLWFRESAPGGDGSYEAAGWNSNGYWQNGVNYDPLQIIAPGGPHGNNPSGIGNTIGLTNFDGPSPPHGATRALPSVPDLAGGESVEVSIKVNLTGVQESNKVSYISVGNSAFLDGVGTDYRSGISFKNDGTGNNFAWQLGPEPAITPIPEIALGWTELKLVINQEYHNGHEADVIMMRAYARAIAGTWSQVGSYANATLWQPAAITLQPTQYATYDDLSIEVTPEPATISLLALGGLAALRRRRRA